MATQYYVNNFTTLTTSLFGKSPLRIAVLLMAVAQPPDTIRDTTPVLIWPKRLPPAFDHRRWYGSNALSKRVTKTSSIVVHSRLPARARKKADIPRATKADK
jgi:hypothetical protein